MSRKILLINFYLMLALYANAAFGSASDRRVIAGSVIDRETKEPLYGALVTIAGTTLGTVSDEQGKFRIDVPARDLYKLRASFVGYQTTEAKVSSESDTANVVFELKQVRFDTDAIIVTATRTEKSLKDVPQLTEVITSQQIAALGSVTVQDALEMTVPSIDFSPDAHGANMQMQGLSNEYVLFLIDGERISGETRGNIDFSRLNVSQIDRIEVTKGAASSLYGSNAIGGVVNIITKKLRNPLEATVSYRGSAYNEHTMAGMFGIKTGILGSQTSIDRKQSDGYDLTPASPTVRTQEKFEDLSINQRFDLALSDKLSLELKGNYYVYERFNAPTEPVHPKNYAFTLASKINYFFTPSGQLSLSWNTDQYEKKDVYELLNDKERLTDIHRINNARVLGSLNLGDSQILTLGIEYLREKLYSPDQIGGEKATNNWTTVAQDEIRLGSHLTAIAGAQLNLHSSYDAYFSPRASLMYSVLPVNIRLSYSNGFRAPTLKELYMNWDHHGMFFIEGSEDLKPETSHYISASVEYISSHLTGSISVYHNNLKDMIRTVSLVEDSKNIERYENIDKAMVQGIDLLVKIDIGYGVSLGGGYSYLDSEDKSTGLQLYGINRHSGRLMADYTLDVTENQPLTLSLQGKFTGSRINEYQNEDGTVKNDNYAPYALWRLTATQQIRWSPAHICLTLGIDNLFDYTDLSNFATISPGRRFFASINLSYN